MYNIKLTDYVPEPKPATTDRVVAAHYYAAWKKGAAGLHNGFDDLHDYPERTPLMGYYDEESPVVCDLEIKWAVEHGINCFIHCWYRKNENEGKPVRDEDVRCGHVLNDALERARFQNAIRFAIMYENSQRWCSTDARDMVENLMPYWTERYFKRENYLKIDGKPVLFVCAPWRMNAAFADAEEQKATFDACRAYAVEQGFEGLLIAACLWDYNQVDRDAYLQCTERGYDFHFSYNAGYSPAESFPSEDEVIEAQCAMLEKRLTPDPMRHIPIASCFRDATPRTTPAWNALGFKFGRETIYHLSPEGFRRVLRRMKETVDALPDGAWGKRIFMLDNWNEWDEGHYIAPSHEHGFRYLQAVREELTLRDNLPDYRTPADLGIEGLNHSWDEPDMRGVCEKKRKEAAARAKK
ncbi:MAG: glycoside hydrolase family 99-like domain-containing protein [Clostridia bacterium]|nr:glycoside hydrolase family 99-like domain-containing protein [Clostridia bacterium]